MDALSGPLRGYPVPGEMTQVVTDSIRFAAGGGAGNTASALGQMGADVAVFSKVGKDPNGEFIIESLRKRGVRTENVCVSQTDSTPFTFVGVHPGGERTFIHTPGANRTFCLDDIDQARLLSADFLLYNDLWVLPLIDGRPGAELLARAREQGVVTLLDECWGLGPRRKVWEMMIAHADYVLPSFDDLSAIYPHCTPEGIVELLHASGRLTRLPARATEIVDTTGAGDCFDAGFIAGLTRGLSDVQAAEIGNLAAAACIRHVGGSVGIPRFCSLRKQLTT